MFRDLSGVLFLNSRNRQNPGIANFKKNIFFFTVSKNFVFGFTMNSISSHLLCLMYELKAAGFVNGGTFPIDTDNWDDTFANYDTLKLETPDEKTQEVVYLGMKLFPNFHWSYKIEDKDFENHRLWISYSKSKPEDQE